MTNLADDTSQRKYNQQGASISYTVNSLKLLMPTSMLVLIANIPLTDTLPDLNRS